MNKNKSQVLFSGIQPSGILHIGNYLGAIKQWVELQDTYRSFFCIVDEHAITVPQDPKELRENTLKTAMMYLAAGIDPKKSTIFVQSHVPTHTELGWILNTMTPLGELERMTQFKEKAGDQRKKTGVFAGLFNYPTLMAADILLYKTNIVPVGGDQLQHVELTRSLAERFNNRFGETFAIPKAMVSKTGARIMGLDDPTKKMSKSAPSPDNYISLLDVPEEIRRKIKIAVTDSGTEIKYDEKQKPAISNLLAIYHLFSGRPVGDLEKEYRGKGYAEFKQNLGDIIIKALKPLQERHRELEKNEDEVLKILHNGADAARNIADKTLHEVKERVGFLMP